jgi:5-methylcytosine-specific restriction enzyme A
VRRVPTHRPAPHHLARGPLPDRSRQQDKNFYSSTRWRKLREAYLRSQPLCEDCLSSGRVEAANHVHHKRPRKQSPHLAFEWDNLEALCHACHNAKEER